ncbi:type II CRISPR-associated endonuclease Cas1 [Streptobacillus notomytis]|uniref:type II CRISPR-associated endonuclease Cas1 n=1 Tax=Streptobacillus notomytis TaxID=1712031 RepID=UPI000936BF6B|nr:type II CRISPR-associated endonuclease Cas1 [Streptobacillus notomytis]
MSFRQVLITKKSYIHFENDNLIVEKDNKKLSVPVNDIAIVVFESLESTVSLRIISELSLRNITMLFCDYKHMPVAYTLPINQHYRIPYVHSLQMQQTSKSKELIWEELLKAKIRNSRKVLEIENASSDVIKLMKKYEKEAVGNDIQNREGTAAKVFFNYLYGTGFFRQNKQDSINMALDYGYGVFRSAITRLLCTLGFTTHIGVHHNSMMNAFNLTYDFIEPYRPIIDYYVFNYLYRFIKDDELSIDARKELISLLNANVMINNKEYTVLYSMELLIKSYLKFLEEGKKILAIPDIIKIDFYDLFKEL